MLALGAPLVLTKQEYRSCSLNQGGSVKFACMKRTKPSTSSAYLFLPTERNINIKHFHIPSNRSSPLSHLLQLNNSHSSHKL